MQMSELSMAISYNDARTMSDHAPHTMDIIAIHDFRVETQIGFYDWERRLPQLIQLDLELGIPGSDGTSRTDRIGDTIDYAAVVSRLREVLRASQFVLLEALSEQIASVLRAE